MRVVRRQEKQSHIKRQQGNWSDNDAGQDGTARRRERIVGTALERQAAQEYATRNANLRVRHSLITTMIQE